MLIYNNLFNYLRIPSSPETVGWPRIRYKPNNLLRIGGFSILWSKISPVFIQICCERLLVWSSPWLQENSSVFRSRNVFVSTLSFGWKLVKYPYDIWQHCWNIIHVYSSKPSLKIIVFLSNTFMFSNVKLFLDNSITAPNRWVEDIHLVIESALDLKVATDKSKTSCLCISGTSPTVVDRSLCIPIRMPGGCLQINDLITC